MKKVAQSYARGSKWLHWLVAIIVISMLSFSFFLNNVPERYQSTAYMLHKSLGLTVLFFMLLRLFWICHKGKPALPSSVAPWERRLSQMVQVIFYVLLIAMPFSGWMRSISSGRVPVYFDLFPVPLYGVPINQVFSDWMANAHEVIAYTLIVLIVLHLAGVFKHQFINKDKILRRMLSDTRQDN